MPWNTASTELNRDTTIPAIELMKFESEDVIEGDIVIRFKDMECKS